MEVALGITALEEEAFDLVGCVADRAVFREARGKVLFETAAQVAFVGVAIASEDLAKDEHFARTEDIGRQPIERGPVDGQAQVTLGLPSKVRLS
jgi:hypothetical protein